MPSTVRVAALSALIACTSATAHAEEPEDVEALASSSPNPWVPRVMVEGRFGLLQAGALGDSAGGGGGLRLTEGLFRSWYFDLFLEAEGGAGYNAASNVMGNLQGGIGMGVNVWRLSFIPVFGGGFDTISGGDADSFQVPMAGLYYFGGYFTVSIVPAFALFGRALRVNRSGDAVPHETRVLAGFDLWFKGPLTYELAFQWIDYGDAKLLGGGLGFGF